MTTLFRVANCLAAPLSVGAFSCLNDAGAFVDYFAALKGNDGTDVHYHDASSGGHFQQTSPLSSDSSAIVRTVKQLYGNLGSTYAYAVYNDEAADGPTSSTRAHSKGVILFDGSQGFWLVHSLPKWPAAVATGYQGLSSTTYGQSYLCMSFRISELETIAKIQLMQWPQIYSSDVTADLAASLPNFKAWIEGGKSSTSQATTSLRSYSGRTFTSYGKSKTCQCNLYSDVVAKNLGGDLWVESWQNGASYLKMPNFCTQDGYPHNIYNIRNLTFQDGRSWRETQDHSKWALSAKSQRSVCIGDLNRQTSQAKRGGGTVCYNNADLWQAFNEIVTTHDPCDGAWANNRTIMV